MLYAVKIGKLPGIYNTWDACKAQVDGFHSAQFKSFATRELAEAWMIGVKVAGYPNVGYVCDGGSKGNPGELFVKVFDLANNVMVVSHEPIIGKDGKPMIGTNNRAEILALGYACSVAKPGNVIYLDSLTAIAWAHGNGNPIHSHGAIAKIQALMKSKFLLLAKWDKLVWDEPPCDCK